MVIIYQYMHIDRRLKETQAPEIIQVSQLEQWRLNGTETCSCKFCFRHNAPLAIAWGVDVICNNNNDGFFCDVNRYILGTRFRAQRRLCKLILVTEGGEKSHADMYT